MTDEAHSPDPYADLSMESLEVGPIPILRRFFDRLQLDDLLRQHVPEKTLGRRPKISHAHALSLMISNVLTSREPLYGVPDWLDRHVPEHLGFGEAQPSRLMNAEFLELLEEYSPSRCGASQGALHFAGTERKRDGGEEAASTRNRSVSW